MSCRGRSLFSSPLAKRREKEKERLTTPITRRTNSNSTINRIGDGRRRQNQRNARINNGTREHRTGIRPPNVHRHRHAIHVHRYSPNADFPKKRPFPLTYERRVLYRTRIADQLGWMPSYTQQRGNAVRAGAGEGEGDEAGGGG